MYNEYWWAARYFVLIDLAFTSAIDWLACLVGQGVVVYARMGEKHMLFTVPSSLRR